MVCKQQSASVYFYGSVERHWGFLEPLRRQRTGPANMAAPRGTLEDQAAEAHHRSHRQSSGAYVAAIPVAKGFPGPWTLFLSLKFQRTGGLIG
jgi:hypothetical protein